LKEFSYSVNIGIIGTKDSNKEIFNSFLQNIALKCESEDTFTEFSLVYRDIPITIKTYLFENLKDSKLKKRKDQKFDVIIIMLNLYNIESFDELIINEFVEFSREFKFTGISVLTGINKYVIQPDNLLPGQKINEFSLIRKTRELNIHYCFKIQNDPKDVLEIFNQIMKDILYKFKTLNPELYEQALKFGEEFEQKTY
jgi:hypothetical protein